MILKMTQDLEKTMKMQNKTKQNKTFTKDQKELKNEQ